MSLEDIQKGGQGIIDTITGANGKGVDAQLKGADLQKIIEQAFKNLNIGGIESTVGNIAHGIGDIYGQVTGGFESLGDALGVDQFQEFGDQTGLNLFDLIDDIRTTATNSGRSITKLLEDVGTLDLSKQFEDLDLGSKIESGLQDVFGEDPLGGIGGTLEQVLKDLNIGGIESTVGNIAHGIGDIYGQVTGGFKDLSKNLGLDQLAELDLNLLDAFKQQTGDITGGIGALLGGLSKQLSSGGKIFEDLTGGIEETLKPITDIDFGELLDSNLNSFGSELTRAGGDFENLLKSNIQGSIDSLDSNLGGDLRNLQKSLEGSFNSAVSQIPSLNDITDEFARFDSQFIQPNFKGIEDSVSSLTEGLGKGFESLGEGLTGVFNGITGGIGGLTDGLGLNNLFDTITGNLQAGFGGIENLINKNTLDFQGLDLGIESLKNFVEKNTQDFSNVEDFLFKGGFQDAIESNLGSIEDFLLKGGLENQVKNLIESNTVDIKNTSDQLSDFFFDGGFEDAMAANSENAFKAIEGLGQNAIDQLINSPLGEFFKSQAVQDFGQQLSDDFFLNDPSVNSGDVETLGLTDNAQGLGSGITGSGATGLLSFLSNQGLDSDLGPVERNVPHLSRTNIQDVIDLDPSQFSIDDSEFKPRQLNLADVLENRVSGNEPSVAELQLKRSRDANINSAIAAAASARGQDVGFAQRNLANTVADVNQQASSDAALLRAQEQAQAEQALGQLLGTGREQDIGQATTGAQLGLQSELANLDTDTRLTLQQALLDQQAEITDQGAILQGRQIDDALMSELLRNALGLEQIGANEVIASRDTTADLRKALLNADVSRDVARQQALGQAIGAAAQGGASILGAFSDERLKENIESGHDDIREFLDSLDVHKYDYIKPELGEGKHVSVMAQELEKTELGKSMVEETPIGKFVDYGKGFGTLLAALVDMNERLSTAGL